MILQLADIVSYYGACFLRLLEYLHSSCLYCVFEARYHPILLFRSELRIQGKTHRLTVILLRLGENACLKFHLFIVGLSMHWNIMEIDTDPSLPHGFKNLTVGTGDFL